MNLCTAVLEQLVVISDDYEFTNCLIKKFLNISDLKILNERLARVYDRLRTIKEEGELKQHLLHDRLNIETQIEEENRRSVSIDLHLDKHLDTLPKDKRKEYETLLQDYKDGKY